MTVRVFPGLNHLFLPAATGAVAEYPTLKDADVPAVVVETLTGWLQRTLRPAKR